MAKTAANFVIHVTVAGWGVDQAEKVRASLALRLRLDSVTGIKSIPTVALLLAPRPGADGDEALPRVLLVVQCTRTTFVFGRFPPRAPQHHRVLSQGPLNGKSRPFAAVHV